MNFDLLMDQQWVGPLIIEMQKAIDAEFSAEDWRELGHLTGLSNYIQQHKRLLRSLDWRDPDYGDCIYQVIEVILRNNPEGLRHIIEHPQIKPRLEVTQPERLIALGFQIGHVRNVPQIPSATEVVRRALADAEQLLGNSGPASAIDRMHTALHGYLKTVCREQRVELPSDATLTLAYKTLRNQHPGLQSLGDHEKEAGKILSSFASTLDALNTLRNHASVAHPNERLVGVAEGMLAINAVRTIFHYLNQKIAQ